MTLKTILKLSRLAVSKMPSGGFKVDGERITYKDLENELCELERLANEDRLRVVNLCKDCEHYSMQALKPVGSCFPKNSCTRKDTDFCSSSFERRTKPNVREIIQKKRAADVNAMLQVGSKKGSKRRSSGK